MAFNELSYVWFVNGQELVAVDQQVSISTSVSHYPNSASEQPHSEQREVTVSYVLVPGGALKLSVRPDAGNFDLHLQCKIRNGDGDTTSVFSEKIKVESEFIDGGEAYRNYRGCVRGHWRGLYNQLQEFSEKLKEVPGRVPDFDVAESWKRFDDKIATAEKLLNKVKGLRRGGFR
ncbi:MAG: hypothetical protein EOO77_38085 [Oxalobacteraceae bacterium]|nr:MAG: hypothetical protein EOO77_38085 [Oxalobacteraceae bacterium]